MAVLAEALSVIVRVKTVLEKLDGGIDAFDRLVPNQTMCADNALIRVGFMLPDDVRAFVAKLEAAGLTFELDGQAADMVVADQLHGFTLPCDWAQFGHITLDNDPQKRIAACRLVGSKERLFTPEGWRFEGSMSQTTNLVPNEHVSKLRFLRRENGIDVYLNPLTGKEMFMGRTGR
jgi:hypothetical protein